MNYNTLGTTNLNVSSICLGSMTWGEQNSQAQAFEQMHYAHDRGINYFDTAELYAVPPKAETYGKTESIIGISNETPWGAMQHLHLAESRSLPRIASIQNPYNLLNRSFEVGLAEISCREKVGLLAYSPLAFGVLSGKYLHGNKPANARITLFEHYTRYSNAEADRATAAYIDIANKHELDPAQMALAFIRQQPFVTSTIIGATDMQQLASNIASHAITLTEECLEEIESVHRMQPNPCP